MSEEEQIWDLLFNKWKSGDGRTELVKVALEAPMVPTKWVLKYMVQSLDELPRALASLQHQIATLEECSNSPKISTPEKKTPPDTA